MWKIQEANQCIIERFLNMMEFLGTMSIRNLLAGADKISLSKTVTISREKLSLLRSMKCWILAGTTQIMSLTGMFQRIGAYRICLSDCFFVVAIYSDDCEKKRYAL
uniref:Uncharacterized protein n=1 Tax=Solanum lycopersicum TaxID=4081 RepID=A0A3Q7EBJ2_SOLLC